MWSEKDLILGTHDVEKEYTTPPHEEESNEYT